jgi:hypothetical protein
MNMEDNLNRIDLLNQALEYRHKDADWLSEQINTPISKINEDLQGMGNALTIRNITKALDVPEPFFWGSMRLVNGKLVEDKPL